MRARRTTKRLVPGTRVGNRYAKLRWNNLFMPFEASALCYVPFSKDAVPYMSKLIRERRHMKAVSDRLGRSLNAWMASIYELYRVKGWAKRDKLGRIVYLPWKMYRDFEDKYKAKFPEYDSPWQKRPRMRKDLIAKIENTLRNQSRREYQQKRIARGYA